MTLACTATLRIEHTWDFDPVSCTDWSAVVRNNPQLLAAIVTQSVSQATSALEVRTQRGVSPSKASLRFAGLTSRCLHCVCPYVLPVDVRPNVGSHFVASRLGRWSAGQHPDGVDAHKVVAARDHDPTRTVLADSLIFTGGVVPHVEHDPACGGRSTARHAARLKVTGMANDRSPRCELVTGRSMVAIQAVQRVDPRDCGRLRAMWLLPFIVSIVFMLKRQVLRYCRAGAVGRAQAG